jgi:competence protein ComEA
MPSRATASDHEAAVARRLELLTDELAGVRVYQDDRGPRPVVPPAVFDEPSHEAPQPQLAQPPGRHLSRRPPRRSRLSSTQALPEALADAVSDLPDTIYGRGWLGGSQLAVVAVLAALGLALTCWWLVRGTAHEVPAPVPVAVHGAALATPDAGPGIPPAGAASSGPAQPRSRVVVDVSGKVRRPGIAVLRAGARVVDAIRAAGGPRPGVDLSALNLARVVADGEQIVVGGTPPAAALTSTASGSPVTGLVDINTADETTLETLPEVGPVTAQSIITWRTQHGGFTSVDQLLEVDGIGDATLAKLTPYVTI